MAETLELIARERRAIRAPIVLFTYANPVLRAGLERFASISVNEGVVSELNVEGGIRTRDEFVLSQFPLDVGDVFEIEKARQGLNNINGTRLFEYVYLEVGSSPSGPALLIRLKERPSQLLRFGLRFVNERKLQASLDIRDENFPVAGTELGLALLGGGRNVEAMLEFKGRRLLNSELAYGLTAMFSRWDSYSYDDAPPPGPNEWERGLVDRRDVVRVRTAAFR